MVGDSFHRDVEAASAVGIPAVWLDRSGTTGRDPRYVDGCIETLADVPSLEILR